MSITEQDMVEMGYAHQIRRDAVATKLVAEPEHLIIVIVTQQISYSKSPLTEFNSRSGKIPRFTPQ